MATLSEKQQVFAVNLALLILFARQIGLSVTLGEVLRTDYQQKEYLRLGLSKTENSRHLIKMAADVYFFKNGVLTEEPKDWAPVGAFWNSLNPKNVCGHNWGWDYNHFEMKP